MGFFSAAYEFEHCKNQVHKLIVRGLFDTMNVIIKSYLYAFLFLLSGFSACRVAALDFGNARNALDAGVANLESLQGIDDGSWGDDPNLIYIRTAMAVQALESANNRTGSYYNGLAWLENRNANNTDLKTRKVVALSGRDIGFDNNQSGSSQIYINNELDAIHKGKQRESQKGWGLSKGYHSSPLDTSFALRALYHGGDSTGQIEAIDYLLSTQQTGSGGSYYWVPEKEILFAGEYKVIPGYYVDTRWVGDGGWASPNSDAEDSSHYWITAEVVLALSNHQMQTQVSSVLAEAATYLATINGTTTSASTLARVILALYAVNGLDNTVDLLLWDLMGKQTTPGNWASILATANSVTTLSHVLGLTVYKDSTRVSVEDEQLRLAINNHLGHAAYGQITQADIDSLVTLNLSGLGVESLDGLEYATNLSSLIVGADTDLMAISDINNVTVVLNSDADVVADIDDNCPLVTNDNQTNMDGDSFGDACDTDIDGDNMPNTWEVLYALNEYNASDAISDTDNDELINIEEYLQGTLPRDPDTDGDTMRDGIEISYGFNPLDKEDGLLDFDVDTMTNAEEVLVGRHPLVNEAVLIVNITGLLL